MRLKQIFSSVLISATLLPVCSDSIVHASDINSVNIYTNNKNVNHNSSDLDSDKDKTTTMIGLSANSDIKSDTANKAELQQIAENLASDGKNSTIVTVTAGKKDTLLSICNENYANIYQTAKLNHLSPTADLKSGQEIKLIANQKSDQIIVNNDHLIKDLIIEQKTENKAIAKARKIVAQEKAVQAEREKDQDAISDANDSLSRLNDALAAGDKQVKADGGYSKAAENAGIDLSGNVPTEGSLQGKKQVDYVMNYMEKHTGVKASVWRWIAYKESGYCPSHTDINVTNSIGCYGIFQINTCWFSYPGFSKTLMGQLKTAAHIYNATKAESGVISALSNWQTFIERPAGLFSTTSDILVNK